MAYENTLVSITLPAGADLSAAQYHVVKVDSGGDVVVAALGDAEAIGVLQNNPTVGVAATVAMAGITKMHASATVTAGQQVGVGTTPGQILDAAITHIVVGTAIVGAAADDYAVVALKIGDVAI